MEPNAEIAGGLSIDEAYACMLEFLRIYRSELHTATVDDVLDEGRLVGTRETHDPGTWGIWMEAVGNIVSKQNDQARQ